MTAPDGRPAVIITANRAAWPRDAYQFEDVSIDGDLLSIDLTHGGGCADHDFALIVGPEMAESDPVQMRGSLAHNAHGDPCRALISRTLVLDLSPLAEIWRRNYLQPTGALILHLDGWLNPIRYDF
jgi:hypothetical protein